MRGCERWLREQLAEHERIQKEAKRRDHRLIGKNLKLFSIQQEAGGGLVFWHPKGARGISLSRALILSSRGQTLVVCPLRICPLALFGLAWLASPRFASRLLSSPLPFPPRSPTD